MTGLFAFCSAHADVTGAEGARRLRTSLLRGPNACVEFEDCDPAVAVGEVSLPTNQPRFAKAQHAPVAVWLCGDLFEPDGPAAIPNPPSHALARYLDAGIAALTSLNGEFLVAVWDGRNRELLLVNDRFGLYPHFYAADEEGFALTPRIRPLVDLQPRRPSPDLTAIAQYLRFQQLLGDRTWVEGVRLLPPGSVLRWNADTNRVDVTPYWSWADVKDVGPISFDEAVAEGTRLLERAVRRRCPDGERIGVFLSGGLDSRILAGLAVERGPVHTFTFGLEGCRDVFYAARLARTLGTSHHHVPFADGRWVQDVAPRHLQLTEAQHSFVHAHGMTMLEAAAGAADVNLTGWDGGTILRGRLEEYDKDGFYRAFADERLVEQRLFDAFCQRVTWPGLTDEEARALVGSRGRDLLERARASFGEEFAQTRLFPAHRRGDYFYARHHMLRSTVNMVVFTRSALTVRCPYFDQDLVSFMYGLPDAIWATPDYVRAAITRRLPRLAWIPGEADLRLPHQNRLLRDGHAFVRRAMGWTNRHVVAVFPDRSRLYADYENSLRRELRPWVEQLLFDERTLSRGLYDADALRALWARHVSGHELHTMGKVVQVMAIEMALRYVVEGETAEAACGVSG